MPQPSQEAALPALPGLLRTTPVFPVCSPQILLASRKCTPTAARGLQGPLDSRVATAQSAVIPSPLQEGQYLL